jgi:hypothetical protein
VTRTPERGIRLMLSSDRTAHAVWNVASDAGLSVGVVNFWNTYPPERIRGVMVSDHLLPGEIEKRQELTRAEAPPSGPVVHPEAWHERVARVVAREERVTDVPDPFAEGGPLLASLPDWVAAGREDLSLRFRVDDLHARIALEIEAEIRPDLLMVLLTGIDRVSHTLWGAVAPPEAYPHHLRFSPAEREAGRAALDAYYAYTDALVGALVDRYGPDDLVIVLSDHGFEAGVMLGYLTGIHRTRKAADGVFFARGSGIPAAGSAGVVPVLDVAPTLLSWLGLPVGDDMDGAPSAFLELPPPQRVPSHDTEPVPRMATGPSGAEEAIVEQLRALGYVE